LFNNAGIDAKGPFADMPWEQIVAVIEVNLVAGMSLIHAALPLLRATPDSLCLSTSSASAIFGTAGLAVYSASKHAVKGLTEALSVEFAAYGVRVADLLPGIIDTGMLPAEAKGLFPKQGHVARDAAERGRRGGVVGVREPAAALVRPGRARGVRRAGHARSRGHARRARVGSVARLGEPELRQLPSAISVRLPVPSPSIPPPRSATRTGWIRWIGRTTAPPVRTTSAGWRTSQTSYSRWVLSAPDAEAAGVGVAAAVAEPLHVDRGAERLGLDRELCAAREPRRERRALEAARPGVVAERDAQRCTLEVHGFFAGALAMRDLRGEEVGPALELRELQVTAVRLRGEEQECEQCPRARRARRTGDGLVVPMFSRTPHEWSRVAHQSFTRCVEPASSSQPLASPIWSKRRDSSTTRPRTRVKRGSSSCTGSRPRHSSSPAARAPPGATTRREALERLEHLDAQRTTDGS
jgi:hypothetical protein